MAEDAMAVLMDTVRAIRNIRSEMNVPPHKRIEVIIVADSTTGKILTDNDQIVTALSGLSGMTVKERLDMRRRRLYPQIISGRNICAACRNY